MRTASVVPLRVGAGVLAALGIFPLAAVIKYAPVLEWLPGAAIEWLVAGTTLIVTCLLIAFLLRDRADRLIDRAESMLLAPSSRDFAAWVALITLGLSLFFAWYCFRGFPLSGDELTQRFQASLLLHGRVSAVAEPNFEFVGSVQSATRNGRWFGQFPIGGVVLLAIGAAINVAWFVNPVLSAWTATSIYRFASQTTDEVSARGASLLFAFSPIVVFMSATEMNHPGMLALLMFAVSYLPEWSRSTDPRRVNRTAMYIGFAVAAAATIRPYDAALAAVVIGIFQLVVARGSLVRMRSFAWLVAGGLVPVTVLLLANWRTTGQPLLFGYDAVNGIGHRPGFHIDPTGNLFTPIQGLHHVSSYLLRMNTSLFAGPLPGLLLVVAVMALTREANRWDYLLLGLIAAVVLGYSAYWAESYVLTAPRFLYAAVPAFVLFAARLPHVLLSRVRGPLLRRAVPLLLPLSIVTTWALPPEVAAYVGAWRTANVIRGPHPEMIADIGRQIDDAGLTDALVFVHESWHGRLAARLRALGAPDLTAESMVTQLDDCALQRALDAEDTLPAPTSLTRVNRVVAKALVAGNPEIVPGMSQSTQLALVGGLIPRDCLPQLLADRSGVVPLDEFLAFDGWDGDGRLGGRVVFARDFGPRNRLLLGRFGDRTWYRYRPRTGPDDTSPVFVPYRPGGAPTF